MNKREAKRFMCRVLSTMMEHDDTLFVSKEDGTIHNIEEMEVIESVRHEFVDEFARRGGGKTPMSRMEK